MNEVLFYVSLGGLIIQSAYLAYISFWPKFPKLNSDQTSSVTVLICAQNEEDHIDILFRAILRQTYSNFKILIVDDQSSDRTVARVRSWQEKYPDRIQLFSILQKQYKGKKGAIWEVLPHIKSEYILFTDADCRPVSKKWIHLMVSGFKKGENDIVLGYSPVHMVKSITNVFQRMQNAWTAWQYIGFAFRGNAYMAVGRNWAVKTSHYREYQNINQHGNIPSGDDDLVLQSLSKEGKIAVQIHPSARVVTWQSNKFRDWFKQRIRHMKAGIQYPGIIKLFLLIFPIAVLLVICTVIFYLITDPIVALAIVSAQFAVWIIFGRNILKRLGYPDLIVKLPFLLPAEFAFQAISFLLTLMGKGKKWN